MESVNSITRIGVRVRHRLSEKVEKGKRHKGENSPNHKEVKLRLLKRPDEREKRAMV